MSKAKFVRTIGDIDPDTGNHVELDIYKHENGGMFAIDSSYVAQVLDGDDDEEITIPDPFDREGLQTGSKVEPLYLEE